MTKRVFHHSRARGRGRSVRRTGASVSGTMGNWVSSLVSAMCAEREKRRVADRALDLYTNDAMAHGVMESLVVEAVGIGQTPCFSPRLDLLGRSPEWGEDYQRQALTLFERWGLDCRKWCDAQRRSTFYGLQALAYFGWKLDGISLFQVVSRPDPLRPLSLALLPIDASRLVSPRSASAEIYDGIEIDADGQPIAVWLRKPGERAQCVNDAQCTRHEIWDARTGLPKLLIVGDVRNISEYRQDSILGPIIKEIRDSNDFVDAALVGALVRNLFVLFVEDMSTGGTNRDTPLEERVLELDKGTVLQGAAREKPQFFSHSAAPNGYQELFGGIVDRVGMATGRGSESVLRRFQASYSASRANIEKAEQYNEYERSILNTTFNQPALAWMQYEGALRGHLPVGAVDMEEHLFEYTRCDFMPQPFRHIDREKISKANTLDLASNTNTLARIHGEGGRDWREELTQRAREKKFIAELEAQYGVSFEAQDMKLSGGKKDEEEDD
ncbi:phage portal protein [Desulfobaculum bizertense]|uniref:phage portal protein n=1 Tax=Desulfobaculum bizertense TaxID=376490 RepID=UPI001F1661E8|nr:phage portal protein [Desulfobaculum bizertense]UIJ38546.1 phage portal protein [Desulfobaculum bizertense]